MERSVERLACNLNAKVGIEQWRRHYNEVRPHSSLGYLTPAEFKALAAVKADACVSLYMPTSPLSEHVQANRIAFKDLAKEAISQLREAGFDKRRLAALEDLLGPPARAVQDNPDDNKFRYRERDPFQKILEFWANQAHGLAVLATPEMMRTFRLPDRPRRLCEVADRFHLTPLIRAMTSPHDAFVLALAEESVRLIRVFVNMPPVRVQVADMPANAEEATRRPSVHVRAPRGHLQNLEGQKVLLDKFVRKVDQALRGVLAGQAKPLILAADEPLASMFRSVNSYPRLVDEVIAGSPDEARPYFRKLQHVRARLLEGGVDPSMLGELSMGMSHDFEVAVEEGATLVRVGTAIFGSRTYR